MFNLRVLNNSTGSFNRTKGRREGGWGWGITARINNRTVQNEGTEGITLPKLIIVQVILIDSGDLASYKTQKVLKQNFSSTLNRNS